MTVPAIFSSLATAEAAIPEELFLLKGPKMNGDDTGFAYDYSYDAPIIPETSTGGIIPTPQTTASDGGGILGTLSGVLDRFTTRPSSTEQGIGGALYNAIYAFGAGKLDQAREQAAKALLASRTGQRFTSTVERERLKQLAPMIILGVVVLFGVAFALGRR